MSRASRSVLGLAAALGAGAAGCYENVATPIDDAGPVVDGGPFLPGLEPWDAVNLAAFPAPEGSDACPETIVFADAPMYRRSHSVHARACIHAPMADVWDSIRNPEVGRDPENTSSWSLLPAPEHFPQCDGADYETHLFVDDVVDIDFYICWRNQLIEGTEDAPLFTASRWGKVFGTSAIMRLEGSLLSYPHPDDPTITALEYQYHLDAATRPGGPSNPETIRAYLTVIYNRLRDDSHGIPITMP